MEEAGLLAAFEKGDYRLLRLSVAGRTQLKSQPEGSNTSSPVPPPSRSQAPGTGRTQTVPAPDETPTDFDQALFERLRAWRLETARAMGKPPFVVFPDKTLKRIAASHPASLEELGSEVIGPPS